jgi:hypothetical protein
MKNDRSSDGLIETAAEIVASDGISDAAAWEFMLAALLMNLSLHVKGQAYLDALTHAKRWIEDEIEDSAKERPN